MEYVCFASIFSKVRISMSNTLDAAEKTAGVDLERDMDLTITVGKRLKVDTRITILNLLNTVYR